MKSKLNINAGFGFDVPEHETISTAKRAGFDGVFIGWHGREETFLCAKEAEKHDAPIAFVHAPFGRVDKLWEDSPEILDVMREIKECISVTAEIGVKMIICHVIIGMERHTPTLSGLPYFRDMADYAAGKGVDVAFENTEGEEYLSAVLGSLSDHGNVGFCFDSGHELCYNGGRDMLGKYGDRLIATHLNDNMGQTGDALTWLDDAHLLPFDGKADWIGIAKRLKAHGYQGDLTFELTRKEKPGRNVSARYDGMDADMFAAAAFERAKRFAALVEKI